MEYQRILWISLQGKSLFKYAFRIFKVFSNNLYRLIRNKILRKAVCGQASDFVYHLDGK